MTVETTVVLKVARMDGKRVEQRVALRAARKDDKRESKKVVMMVDDSVVKWAVCSVV